ncbi:MAG: hypothetical protein RBU29_11675 [bacterium]|nr:hypothetical protein [bacterium]
MRTWLFDLAFVVLLSQAFLAQADTPQPLLGDEGDGSRAIPVHRIPLLDEGGIAITPDDEPLVPFSPRQTCAKECHSYSTIASGWHFNALDAESNPGRPGHPWIYWDARLGIQIPLSYRAWPGVFSPDEIGMQPWEFILRYGRHLPGGGIGEIEEGPQSEKLLRWMVSGQLEINCLACHNAAPEQDQSEYATQIGLENFRWATAAASGLAFMEGSARAMPDTYDYLMPDEVGDPKLTPPTIQYQSTGFDPKNRVFFNITRTVPNERCYFCHSSFQIDSDHPEKWSQDQDIHLTAGLRCVDCHRHGLDHTMVRGYAGEVQSSTNPLAFVSTCEGCHLGQGNAAFPQHGRFAAPVPQHAGFPPIHFEKLSCTACHAGPWPGESTQQVKTAMAHGLGIKNSDKSPSALPHIMTPVFVNGDGGKLEPHHLVWPSYWARFVEEEIVPIPTETIRAAFESITSSTAEWQDGWQTLPEETLSAILSVLAADPAEPRPAYISGGKIWQQEQGQLVSQEHPAAAPYTWPVAHNVRPAAQSLGARGCEDCHSVDAPLFFGDVQVDSPILSLRDTTVNQVAFQDTSGTYLNLFALTFAFRPLFKLFLQGCTILLLMLAAVFLFKLTESALAWIQKTMDRQ